jgi:hypothetical protein
LRRYCFLDRGFCGFEWRSSRMMETPYWEAGKVAHILDRIADQVDAHRQAGHPIYLPPELVKAARRIVEAADWGRSQVVVEPTSIIQAVFEVMDISEVVTASILRDRLAKAGRSVALTSITVALHRACQKGDMVTTSRGRFRLPTVEEQRVAQAVREGMN